MKIIVAGSRGFNNYELLKDRLNEIIGDNSNIEIVSGMARGADLLGVKYGKNQL